jgi:membrane fusion protein
MSQDLFRQEVLVAQRGSYLGRILLAQPLRFWVLTCCAVGAAAIVIAFLTLGNYTRRVRVTGQLTPTQGLVTITSPATGMVPKVSVKEGEHVTAGQILAVVVVPRATSGIDSTLLAVEQQISERKEGVERSSIAQDALLRAQLEGLVVQESALQSEILHIEKEVETRSKQVELAERTLERLRQLRKDQYVSDVQLQQQESALLEQRAEMQMLQRQGIAARRHLGQLQQVAQEIPAQRESALAVAKRDLATLKQEAIETRARSESVIQSPAQGVISAQLVKSGQAVQAGQPLMAILPGDGHLQAELLVPSRAIGFVASGDRVLLRYQAFPYQKFGHHTGRVIQVSRSALSAEELGAQTQEPFYRVVVSLDAQTVLAYGKREPLKPGMLLDADIMGEQRSLIEWVFDPLYSIKGKLLSGS